MQERIESRAEILNFPCSADRLPNGNTLISDAGDEQQEGSQILEVDRTGNIVWSHQGDLAFPHSADLLPNGNILVADTTNNRVVEITRDHRIVFSTESWKDGTGRLSDGSHLDYPNDVHTLPDGCLLITDRNNDRFVQVSRSGEVLRQFSTGIRHPHNADPLPNGNCIIADSDNNRVIEVDVAGGIVWSYGDPSRGEELNWPRDADRLPNGNTLICDSKNSRVLEVSPDRRIVWSFALPYFANFYDADPLPNGNVLITDQQHQRVIEVDRSGAIVWQFRNYIFDRPVFPRIENGSFRRFGAAGVPYGWSLFTRTAEGGGSLVSKEDERGRKVVGLSFDRNGGFGISQMVAVRPGLRYRVGASLQVEDVREPAAAFLQCAFRDRYAGLFEDVFSAPKGQLLTGTTGWVQDTLETVAPDGSTMMEVRILITGPGTIWIRDLLLASA